MAEQKRAAAAKQTPSRKRFSNKSFARGWRKPWYIRMGDASKRWHWPLWILGLLLTMITFVWILIIIGQEMVTAFKRGEVGKANYLILPEQPELNDSPLPEFKQAEKSKPAENPAAQVTTAGKVNQEPVTPSFPWKAPSNLYRAAADLAAAGHLESALQLLVASEGDSPDTRKVAAAEVARTAKLVDQAAVREVMALAAFWEKIPTDERILWYCTEERAEMFADHPIADASWPALAAHLPISLFALFVGRSHEAACKQGASPGIAKVYLQMRAVNQPLLPIAFGKVKDGAIGTYSDHIQWFTDRLDQTVLEGLVAASLREERFRIIAAEQQDKPRYAWCRLVWGDRFCRRVTELPDNLTVEQAADLWKELSSTGQGLWRTSHYRMFIAEHGPLAPAVLKASVMLSDGSDANLDEIGILLACRKHPAWQKLMTGFDYDRAILSADEVIGDLRAEAFAADIKGELAAFIIKEKEILNRWSMAEWERVSGMVDVAEVVPPAFTGKLGEKTRFDLEDPPVYNSWRELNTEEMLKKMERGGRSLSESSRRVWREIVNILAINRGMARQEKLRDGGAITLEPVFEQSP